MKTITVEVSDTVYSLLEVLTHTGALDGHKMTVEQVLGTLVDHAQQGVYRPGAWERAWLCQVFGDDWTEHLEPGDPYGRPGGTMFQRPRRRRATSITPRRKE